MSHRWGYRALGRLLIVAAAVAWCGPGLAQVAAPDEEERPKPHHLSLFVGARYEDAEEEDDSVPFAVRIREDEKLLDLTVGLNFEYLGRDNVGVTLFGQRTGGDTDSWLVGAGMNVHGGRTVYFQFATIYEWRPEDGEGSIRAGLGWELRTGKKRRGTVSPSIGVDFGSERVVLWGGLAIGRRF